MHPVNTAWLVPNVLILLHLNKRVCFNVLFTYFGTMLKFKLKGTCAGITEHIEQLFPTADLKSLKLPCSRAQTGELEAKFHHSKIPGYWSLCLLRHCYYKTFLHIPNVYVKSLTIIE